MCVPKLHAILAMGNVGYLSRCPEVGSGSLLEDRQPGLYSSLDVKVGILTCRVRLAAGGGSGGGGVDGRACCRRMPGPNTL